MRLELSKRADYAVRAMVALAMADADTRLSVTRIAAAMAIPVRFLPQVMRDLMRARLVGATPGRTGGYRLARPSAEISLLDVIEAIEGDSRRRMCVLRGGACGDDGHCDVHAVFMAGQEAMLAEFRGADLATIRDVAVARARPGSAGQP